MPSSSSMPNAEVIAELAAMLGPDRVLGAAEAERYAVDGRQPFCAVFPETIGEVASVLRHAGDRGLAVIPWGSGTLIDLGNAPSRYDIALVLTRLDAISDYSPEDLVVTVQAGATIGAVNATLARHGQFLALDPPRADVATIGGALSAGISGPMRQRYGGARDLVIGLTCVLAGGEIVHSGGRVVKNVAGYDLNKLFLGAIGSAGVIVEASFKLHPLPASGGGVTAEFSSCAGAHAAALALINSRFGPTAVEIASPAAVEALPAAGLPSSTWLLAAQCRGLAPAVERQLREMGSIVREAGGASLHELAAEEADALFGEIRDCGRRPDAQAELILRCALLPSELATAVEHLGLALAAAPPQMLASPGIGILRLLWPSLPTTAEALVQEVRSTIETLDGIVTVERCPPAMKTATEIWGVSGPDLALMVDLKAAYDSNGTLSPGRFVGRI
jgi:glycolate oxidase FAD binding subunit